MFKLLPKGTCFLMFHIFLLWYKRAFYHLTFLVGHIRRILCVSQVYDGCVGCALVLRWFCIGSLDTLRWYLRRYLRWFCVGSTSVLDGALVLLRWLQYPTQRRLMLGKLKNSLNSLISHKLKCIQLMIATIKQGAYAFSFRGHSYSHKFAPKNATYYF